MRRHRSLTFAAVTLAVCAFTTAFFGHATLSAQDPVTDQYKVFTAALSAVENNYLGEVQSDRLVYSAISGLLQTLDPHSSFMDPRSFAQSRERQEGRYYGIGVLIRAVNGDITVAGVYEGTPAYESGMRRGDIIASIETEATKGWNSDRVVGKIKGPKGTSVNLTIRRGSYPDPIPMRVRRDEVRISTVPAAVMLDATTGYIKLQDFGEHTDQDLGNALADLTKKGMKRLIFDLRGNPGGALDQAILVANRFLKQGSLIVYTRGRTENSDQDYRATEPSNYLDLPMITLVNRSSASASEIVSGALQDHDRSLIVGETTFGKALVQSVYRLSEGAGAAITTARYYTPSGRLIQRPWDSSFDEYLTYTLRDQNSTQPRASADLKYTDGGRRVYGGGGVEPDRRFDGFEDGFTPSRLARTIAARGLFESYAERFAREGDSRAALKPGTGTAKSLSAGFDVSNEMVGEFKKMVQQAPIRFDDAAWQADLPYITASIQKEINSDLFGLGQAYADLAKRDPQLQFSLGLFAEAQSLLQMNQPGRRVAKSVPPPSGKAARRHKPHA
jgi:carboxyl-terminal processing protease